MKEENETRNNVMSLKRAETIAGKYLCNRCWKPLVVINTDQQKGYPICANKWKEICKGGSYSYLSKKGAFTKKTPDKTIN